MIMWPPDGYGIANGPEVFTCGSYFPMGWESAWWLSWLVLILFMEMATQICGPFDIRRVFNENAKALRRVFLWWMLTMSISSAHRFWCLLHQTLPLYSNTNIMFSDSPCSREIQHSWDFLRVRRVNKILWFLPMVLLCALNLNLSGLRS